LFTTWEKQVRTLSLFFKKKREREGFPCVVSLPSKILFETKKVNKKWKPVVWPYGQALPSCPCLTKKIFFEGTQQKMVRIF